MYSLDVNEVLLQIENTITPGWESMVISIGHIFFLIKDDYL